MLDPGRGESGLLRHRAKSSQPPDERLVSAPGGPFEGLVIEARTQQTSPQAETRERVVMQAGPAILAAYLKAIAQRNYGRGCVWNRVQGRADCHESARLVDSRREYAATPSVLDAACEQSH